MAYDADCFDNDDDDGDGLIDKREVELNTDPIKKKDTDDDGLNDKEESDLGTNPNLGDSDDDGLLDGMEIDQGTNPGDPDSRVFPPSLKIEVGEVSVDHNWKWVEYNEPLLYILSEGQKKLESSIQNEQIYFFDLRIEQLLKNSDCHRLTPRLYLHNYHFLITFNVYTF